MGHGRAFGEEGKCTSSKFFQRLAYHLLNNKDLIAPASNVVESTS